MKLSAKILSETVGARHPNRQLWADEICQTLFVKLAVMSKNAVEETEFDFTKETK